jgi:rSAM/selenodomain-associated transferase 1
MNNGRLLIIFTKNPEAGLVKTRLAETVGDERALEVYEVLREHTALVTVTVEATRVVYYSRFIPASDLFLTNNFTLKLQEGDDLGMRMQHAISTGFTTGFRHIVLIGTDCYELTSEHINQAFTALERSDADAVVGPATDGGFYLIGLKRQVPELFLNRQWSTPEVFRETIEILRRFAIPCELLAPLPDIDTFEDLKKSALWTSDQ